MPPAARVSDMTGHPGIIAGPGVSAVLICGMPAAVAGDLHSCLMLLPPPAVGLAHPPSTFSKGSASVTISGRSALRIGDTAGCGSPIILGALTVVIGG